MSNVFAGNGQIQSRAMKNETPVSLELHSITIIPCVHFPPLAYWFLILTYFKVLKSSYRTGQAIISDLWRILYNYYHNLSAAVHLVQS